MKRMRQMDTDFMVAEQGWCQGQDSTTPYPLQLGGELNPAMNKLSAKHKMGTLDMLSRTDHLKFPSKIPLQAGGVGVVSGIKGWLRRVRANHQKFPSKLEG